MSSDIEEALYDIIVIRGKSQTHLKLYEEVLYHLRKTPRYAERERDTLTRTAFEPLSTLSTRRPKSKKGGCWGCYKCCCAVPICFYDACSCCSCMTLGKMIIFVFLIVGITVVAIYFTEGLRSVDTVVNITHLSDL